MSETENARNLDVVDGVVLDRALCDRMIADVSDDDTHDLTVQLRAALAALDALTRTNAALGALLRRAEAAVDAVGLREIAATADDGGSGRTLVSIRRYNSAGGQVGFAHATLDVWSLLVGVIDLIRVEVGEIGVVALVVREHARSRAIACLAQGKL